MWHKPDVACEPNNFWWIVRRHFWLMVSFARRLLCEIQTLKCWKAPPRTGPWFGWNTEPVVLLNLEKGFDPINDDRNVTLSPPNFHLAEVIFWIFQFHPNKNKQTRLHFQMIAIAYILMSYHMYADDAFIYIELFSETWVTVASKCFSYYVQCKHYF